MKVQSRTVLSDNKKIKNFQKVTLKLILPCGEAKNNSVLGPLLGQHQINIMSFCNEFNTKSVLKYSNGIPLAVYVSVGKDRTYVMNIGHPSLSFFLNQISEKKTNQKNFNISKLYDVAKFLSFFLEKDIKSVTFLILGYLSSGSRKYNYKISV